MGQQAGALFGAGTVATLNVEGRQCAARPLRGTRLGSVCGLCLVVDSPESLREAIRLMPGRILVLAGGALTEGVLEMLPGGEVFSAIVVLSDDRAALDRIGTSLSAVPAVAVGRPSDQDALRRAVRATVTVQDGLAAIPTVPSPRHAKRRRSTAPVGHRMPGTIDLRKN